MRSMVVGECREGDDRGNDRVQIPEDLCRIHPGHPVPVLFQKPVPQHVTLRPVTTFMRLAVHFHDKRGRSTIEINHIGAHRMLPAKLDPRLLSSKRPPEQPLGQRHLPPQFAGGGNFGPQHLPHSPSTAFGGPPPRSGEEF